MSKEEFISLLDDKCESTKRDIETRFYPSETEQLASLREEFKETVALLTADCDLNEEVKAKSDAPEGEKAEANDQEEAKLIVTGEREAQFNSFQILNTGADCLKDDFKHGYTIFDDPQKEFAVGSKFSPDEKRKEREASAHWGKIDDITFSAKLKEHIESEPEIHF